MGSKCSKPHTKTKQGCSKFACQNLVRSGCDPGKRAVNTTRKPSRGLASLRVKIWCDRAATLSKCCICHTKTEQGFSNLSVSKFGAIGLRPCKRAVNTKRKPSRGLATFRVKIWCDRAVTLSKCCKYHTKTEQGFSNFACQNWCDRAATLSKCCKYHTKTEQGFSNFPCQNLVLSGCDLVKVL